MASSTDSKKDKKRKSAGKTKEKDSYEDMMEFGVPLEETNGDTEHNYSQPNRTLSDPALLSYFDCESPVKPAGKQQKGAITLETIAQLINDRSDDLALKIDANKTCIDDIKKSLDYIYEEVDFLKAGLSKVTEACDYHDKKLGDLELRLNEAELYQRRWNLRIHGIPEQAEENMKKRVIQICKAVAPDTTGG